MSTVPAPGGPTYRSCFVCTGNICRSRADRGHLRELATVLHQVQRACGGLLDRVVAALPRDRV